MKQTDPHRKRIVCGRPEPAIINIKDVKLHLIC